MADNIRGILIDPFAQTVTWHELPRDYREIYKAIQARPFDVIRLPRNHAMYVDDEGLFRDGQKFWQLQGYPTPIAGRALILGTDDAGDSQSCTLDLARVQAAVTWRPHIEVEGWTDGETLHDEATGWTHITFGAPRFAPKRGD